MSTRNGPAATTRPVRPSRSGGGRLRRRPRPRPFAEILPPAIAEEERLIDGDQRPEGDPARPGRDHPEPAGEEGQERQRGRPEPVGERDPLPEAELVAEAKEAQEAIAGGQ